MDGKKLVLLGILVIAAGAAFVYYDPMDMDLLGMKKVTVVAKPATPHAASKAVAPPPKKAPVAAASPSIPAAPAATSSLAAPKPVAAPTQAESPAAPASPAPSQTTVPAAAVPAAPAAPAPVAAEAQDSQPPMKLSQETKAASKTATDKPPRPKNQDLRYCLDLETNEAIAKCAGE